MGISAQTTPFRSSSYSPSYFWFCRSCIQFYLDNCHRPFRSGSRKTFCRLEDCNPHGANAFFSSAALNVNPVELKQRSNYGTLQYDESQIHYRQSYEYSHPPSRKPFFHHRDVESREEDSVEVWQGIISPGHTTEDWGKATEECKKDKIQFAYRNNTTANLQALPEEDITKTAKFGETNVYVGRSRPCSKEEEDSRNVQRYRPCVSDNQTSVDQVGRKIYSHTNNVNNLMSLERQLLLKVAQPNGCTLEDERDPVSKAEENSVSHETERDAVTHSKINTPEAIQTREKLGRVYKKVLVVDSISSAREVVSLLINKYRHLIHACDTEVARIDVKDETPIDHGEIICFSLYSGPDADFGHGKSCIWVD